MPPVPPPAPVVVPKLAPGAVPPSRAVTSSDKARARGRPPAPQPVHVPQVATPEADAAAAARAAAESAELEQTAQMAAAMRAEQKAIAEAEAQAARDREAAAAVARAAAARQQADQEFKAESARTMAALAGMTVELDPEEADIFAAAEGAEAPHAEAPAADDFDINECLGSGGVAASWSLHDGLFTPIVYDATYGYEYRAVTQTADGDFVVRRYFVHDADQYAAFTIGLGRPMPNSHFTHAGHNFVLFGEVTYVFYSPPALERALRIHERLANQATPDAELARLMAGTPGLDGRTFAAFEAQTRLPQPDSPAVRPVPAAAAKPSLPTPARRR